VPVTEISKLIYFGYGFEGTVTIVIPDTVEIMSDCAIDFTGIPGSDTDGKFVILCEATSKPRLWSNNWIDPEADENDTKFTVVWGVDISDGFVYKKNGNAMQFYQRHGFVAVEERIDTSNNEVEVLMKWNRACPI
jgi:hypothetical protein